MNLTTLFLGSVPFLVFAAIVIGLLYVAAKPLVAAIRRAVNASGERTERSSGWVTTKPLAG